MTAATLTGPEWRALQRAIGERQRALGAEIAALAAAERKVRQVLVTAVCDRCGQPLGDGRRATGYTVCLPCEQQRKGTR